MDPRTSVPPQLLQYHHTVPGARDAFVTPISQVPSGDGRNSWEDLGTMAAPGKCHEEKAPEGGSPLSKVLFPHCLRTFSCPNVFPQVTGLCLNPDSPTAPHRWAETHCAWGHRGTADFRDMWMLRWSLVTLWWLPVLLPVHLAACCCIQCPREREQSRVRVGGPGDATSPGYPALYFTCGLFAVGTCPFTSCSRVFRTSAPCPISCPSPNHPLPERKP